MVMKVKITFAKTVASGSGEQFFAMRVEFIANNDCLWPASHVQALVGA